MKKLLPVLLLLAVVGVLIWFWDSTAPSIESSGPEVLGRNSELSFEVSDPGKGLRSLKITLQQEGREVVLAEEAFDRIWLPWNQSETTTTYSFSVDSLMKDEGVREGPLVLQARAEDQANLIFFSRSTEKSWNYDLDTTPPGLSVLSRQHYITQGGSEAVLYEVQESDVASGVQVGERSFRGYPLGEGRAHIALFALGYDAAPSAPIRLWAEDRAGNRTEVGFWHRIKEQEFRRRRIQITDSFIAKVAPEILSRSPEADGQGSPLENFLVINRDLRRINNEKIAEISNAPSPERLWSEPFLQLTNSQVESVFADQRSYMYEGEQVDEQTHLGFDLASLAQSPVEASNTGRVAHADYLGIYGNTVILEHGWGLYSLYGHLSSIAVQAGQEVARGEVIGRTGQTGLAGGDHLHFSMILQGVQVNPIEWWDAQWVENHINAKLP